MNRRPLWRGIGASIGMLILILDGKTALEGARIGIDLCLKTVIPSLFPFFLLCILLTSSLSGHSLGGLRPLGRLFNIPQGAESILIAGFLGGYPVGAQSIASAYRSGQLSKADAQRLVSFCSNAGPAFLFGMIAPMFPRRCMAWALWGIHIGSAMLVSFALPRQPSQVMKSSPRKPVTLADALWQSLRVMATVCGWVVLFRVVIAFLSRWILWLFPAEIQVVLIGLLELSNGCCELLAIPDVRLRFVLCAGMLSFGGVCVVMQTASVINGLGLRHYLVGKLFQSAFSLLLASVAVLKIWLPCCFGIPVLILILRWAQKRSSIPEPAGV